MYLVSLAAYNQKIYPKVKAKGFAYYVKLMGEWSQERNVAPAWFA